MNKNIVIDNYVKKFFFNGLISGGFGPIIYAIVMLSLGLSGTIDMVSYEELTLGISSSYILAFIAGGISFIYEFERLPLVYATLIHGAILYLDYILIYILNGWVKNEWQSILIWTAIFIGIYIVVWLIVYFSIKAQANRINKKLGHMK